MPVKHFVLLGLLAAVAVVVGHSEAAGQAPGEASRRSSPFQLRATGDFAGTGMRSQDPRVTFWVTNSGPADAGGELRGRAMPFGVMGTAAAPTSYSYQNYEIQFYAAAARGDWVRNREVAPSLANALGGGWTTITNLQLLGLTNQWQAKDNTVGLLHSGIQAAPEGCLDHGGAGSQHYPYGFPLLPGSDCPDTWGTAGWAGRRWVGPVDNWRSYFESVSPSEFRFDWWRVPEEFKQKEKDFIGNFHTYGAATDHGAETLRLFGNVIPGQSGAPQVEGYPIGLTISFQAYSFAVPAVSGGFIYEGFIINDSEEVYGVGLDYDSLYFGLMMRPNRNNNTSTSHAIPEMGAWVTNEYGNNCSQHSARTAPAGVSCFVGSNRARRGFNAGAQGVIWLKSPLGDLRNKHFSDPNSPFYSPGHPLAGDTITYNRMAMCGEYCTQTQFIFARRGFGVLAAQPEHALAGRDPRALPLQDNWHLFHSWYPPQGSEPTYCDPSDEGKRKLGCFPHYVPGALNDPAPQWTYTNRPPGAPIGPDTLWFDTCRPPADTLHPHANRCTTLWADTMIDRTLNFTQRNTWIGSGPFPLKSGDSVAFAVAIFAAHDSASFADALRAWYDFYTYDFLLGPSLPPPPGIAQVEVLGGAYQYNETLVRLHFDDAAERFRDDYAFRVVQNLREPPPGSIWERIADADPGAADRLLAAADRNLVDTVYIYKTCDGGRTVTAEHSPRCAPSPARGARGEAIGTGWQVYAILAADANGSLPRQWEDTEVPAGRSYIYSLQAVTSGIELETQYVADPTTGEIRDTVLTIVPPGRTSFGFSNANPWVAEVYVPARPQAGFEPARAELVAKQGAQRFGYYTEFRFLPDAGVSGRFKLVFGDDGVVREYLGEDASQVDSTTITLSRSALARLPSGAMAQLPYSPAEYRGVPGIRLHMAVDSSAFEVETLTVTGPGGNPVTVRETRMNRKTGLLLDGSGEALFASGVLTLEGFTPDGFPAHPRFPEFTVGVDDRSGQSIPGFGWWYRSPNPEEGYVSIRYGPALRWRGGSATAVPHGHYYISFAGPSFGHLKSLPVVDIRNPARTAEQYAALLDRRPVGLRTEVNQEVLAAIQRDMDPTIQLEDLIEVRTPLRAVRNVGDSESDFDEGRPVRIAMLRQNKIKEVLLGNAPDSVTVPVPEDVWIPGEPLIFLEDIQIARTTPAGELALDGSGEPIWDTELAVTFTNAMLSCGEDPRPTCNPARGPGMAGYPGHVEVREHGHPDAPSGWEFHFIQRNRITAQTMFEFDVHPVRVGERIERLTQEDLRGIRVVPNPYVAISAFEYTADVRRLMFTGLPPRGRIFIFTARGQFVQQLQWEPTDLRGHGDLLWNMETREGNLIAAGLYVYVVETNDPATGQQLRRTGKFVVIK